MAFIIGTYNKYDAWDRAHSVYKFVINDIWYAVKEVEMMWGVPTLGCQVDKEDMPEAYYIYEKLEDAMKFVWRMKGLNCARTTKSGR